MKQYLNRTTLITGIEQAIKLFVDEGLCIDRKEAWTWFTNLTRKNRYSDCSDNELHHCLEQMRLYWLERPSKIIQHNNIKCLLEKLVQHGVYSDDTQAKADFNETWGMDPKEMTYLRATDVIEHLTSMLPKEL